ncbi:MgtC/SapB family protein [Lichenicoccus roseus]|uniref:Protein MgtC n=1 Tax=Lichenicoccus roseus TaxID=2683649 RepID=A0A5R9J8H6_9PROT|nr:MgtC/SapB family protein [Lichenicoccus roseus]TLU73920.1 MgtC/SapB family protein [Lichenicoccus roseus]
MRGGLLDPAGQGGLQLIELGLAFVLSAVVGLEREFRQKSAGLRTYTLVGLASALIMLISKYGFSDVLANNRVVLDPSRVAAQVVSGIGFIGAGVIFLRRDSVRGLTTAASVWLTAALGMACGAGLPILALAATCGHLVIMFIFPLLVRRLPRSRWAPSHLTVAYRDGRGILRHVLVACGVERFVIDRVQIEHDQEAGDASTRIVTLSLEVRGGRPVTHLSATLSEIDGVVSVRSTDVNAIVD